MKQVTPRFEFVVSVENRPYQVWQAMLFHYSCCKHQGQAPLTVVHKGDEPLLDGFERIVRTGGAVQTAANYRDFNQITYPPRNTAATLRSVQCDADYIVLCEPDMVFLQPLSLAHLGMTQRQVSFDRVTYLEANRESYQPALDEVCRRAGVDPQQLRTRPINGGVPHILPICLQKELSEDWLHGVELFANFSIQSDVDGQAGQAEPGIHWIASMWAIVLAVHRLQLEPVMTQFCVSNLEGHRPLPPLGPTGPKIIHYCYGGDDFNKRAFRDLGAARHLVWNVPPNDGSINGAIRGQLHEAREFFSLPRHPPVDHSRSEVPG